MFWCSRVLFSSARVIRDRTRLANKKAINLTPKAIEQIKALLSAKPGAEALKIGVQQRGCNGLTYTLDYANAKGKFDEEIVQDGVKIWIDSKAQLSLLGSEMDFEETRLASEFIFKNPNIKSTCGCGESFNI